MRVDEFGDPISEAQQFSSQFAEIEALGQMARMRAEVMMDLQRRGPIYDLVLDRRRAALTALHALVTCPADETAAILGLQEQVKSYIAMCEWIHTKLEEGRQADQEIRSTWGAEGHDDGDAGPE